MKLTYTVTFQVKKKKELSDVPDFTDKNGTTWKINKNLVDTVTKSENVNQRQLLPDDLVAHIDNMYQGAFEVVSVDDFFKRLPKYHTTEIVNNSINYFGLNSKECICKQLFVENLVVDKDEKKKK